MDHHSASIPDLNLLSQALTANVNPFIITDAQQLDMPIVYVNPAFEQLSGYRAAEIIGRNCRFMQGQDRDQDARREIRDALAQGQSTTTVLRNYRKDGTLFYNELTLSPLRDVAGILTHFVGFQNDVTSLEEALRGEAQAREQLSATLNRMTDGFLSFDKDWKLIYINKAAARIAGRQPEDFAGLDPFAAFSEHRDAALSLAVLQAVETGTTQSAVSYLPAFGRWIELTAYPGDDGMSMFLRDVTESREAQRELQVSEERFAKVFQTSPISIFIIRSKDGTFVDVNEEFLRQIGYRREDIIGNQSQNLISLVDPADRDETWDTLDPPQPIQSREILFYNKAGEAVHGVLTIVPTEVAGETCTICFMRDVTEEKRAQHRLEASEARLRNTVTELQRTLDLSLDMIVTVGADDHLIFVRVSAASSRILGYAPEEMLGRSAFDFVHPDDAAMTSVEGQHISSGQATTTFQNRYLHKDGSVVWLEWSAVVVPDERLLYGVARDITQRQSAEEDQAFLVAIVHASHNAIIGLSLDGIVRSWNPGAEELYGYTAAEVIGQPITFLIPAEFQILEMKLIERARRGERDPPFEAWRITKSGKQIQVVVTISPVLNAAAQVVGFSKITRDITSLREAEHEVQTLNENLRDQLRHVTGLQEIDRSIAASAGLDVTLGLILDNIMQRLNADAVTVLLLDQHTLTLEYAAARGFTTALHDLTLQLGEGLGGQVAVDRQPMLIPDLRTVTLSPTWWAMLQKERIMAYYGAPIIAKGKVLGVIEVLHRKPFDPSATWLETFGILDNQAAIAVDSSWLFTELERKNLELRLAYDETIEGWARALDLRDHETEGHSRRVTEMTVALCQHLSVPPEKLVDVRRGALLHDIGKMGVPDAVLLKPGKLTEDEWVMMRKHPGYAVDLLSPIEYLRPALDIPQYHHEKWDGSGYPLGLKGEAIPRAARAFAVVDVYDALTSNRPYRKAWTRKRALEHIQNGAGTHFDPAVVMIFMQMLHQSAP
ncbi:PAS domain S-box protein [Deinococcus detaillensis]|uniref:PAS domain S-box protein n=1 Tax=Deinococcus detaillensis TaxID=2592048 RepID=A0A553UNE2_9DEIO|nr:PAS domain S-box protein [Deinococcus detaillensis]TSA81705.1 PAS domain S-box protein [Deinococcus detaillensis]